MRRVARVVLSGVAVLALVPVLLVLLYRVVPAPGTPLMLLRAAEGYPIRADWVSYESLSPSLRRAVIASEDANFCHHHGFDWTAIQQAWAEDKGGKIVRGGSTISQQTAKNLFLWPGGGWIRKAAEIYPTVLLELLWPKRRIMEAYLNIIEWGPGIYGAEAASETYFHRQAADLTPEQAALLTAVLPNPRRWSPASPTAYIAERAGVIAARMPAAPADCD